MALQPPAPAPRFAVLGQPADAPPRCPGVYRFLDASGNALYVGKSIDLRTRIRSHLSEARHGGREHRLVTGTALVDCRPTAGEAGALLLENAAIKREMPLFNRRQRSVRRMWSIVLEDGEGDFLLPRPLCFALETGDRRATYGSFANRFAARKTLERLARREALCPRMMGLESGRGACFQYQIRRCLGACAGEESAAEHNARLLQALQAQRLSAWPVTGPLLLHEQASGADSAQPAQEWHLVHNWAYLGTFSDPAAARGAVAADGYMFDKDTYQILRGVLRKLDIGLYCADSLLPVAWPEAP